KHSCRYDYPRNIETLQDSSG
ncbi:hypothetical protein V3C99_004900, partial [Haemonchus contortus]